jgi:ParB family transcriptional regulator, chromosome partitioning protein
MLTQIKLSAITPNPDQPRKTFDPEPLAELAASIKANGLIQPITVKPLPRRKYMIIAGERRWRAYTQAFGKRASIPCIVSSPNDQQLDIAAIIENDQRENVNPMEQARAYQRMIDVHGMDADALAHKIGKRPSHVAERLRLLNLLPECQQLLATGNLYWTQAFYLAGLSNRGQAQLLRQIREGRCRTVSALKAIAESIAAAEAQVGMFGATEAPAATPADVKAASGFEAKLERVADMLRAGIDENTVTAVRKVDPSRAATIAELLAAMQRDMHRIETAFRASAVIADLV